MFENEEMYADVGSSYTPAPAGNHIGFCCGVVLLGTVDHEYQGHKSRKKKLRLFFELTNTSNPDTEGAPFIVSKEYLYSLGPKANLKKMLDGWRGEALTKEEAAKFNIAKILEAPCMVNVLVKTSAKQNKYNDISSISQIAEGTVVPAMKTKPFLFNFNPPFKTEIFNSLPEWIQKIIQTSDEYKALTGGAVGATTTTTPAANPVQPTVQGAKKLPF
ncbi:MAG TPA: hypothetical protein VD905_06240 [Flavobacteriales bacterium]|nr:hypothetical protein [Flavobacteriales bacterium]